jgi:hypothetical protein
MREMERHLPETYQGARESVIQPEVFSTDLILSEGYVIDDVGTPWTNP